MQSKRGWFSVSPLAVAVLALVVLVAALAATSVALANDALTGQMLALLRVIFLALVEVNRLLGAAYLDALYMLPVVSASAIGGRRGMFVTAGVAGWMAGALAS